LISVDPARIDYLLERFRSVRALVVGDLMLDRYVSGSVDRVSPEAPVPVVKVELERIAVGGAANVAANVTGLGGLCAVIGCVGEDGEGSALLDALAACGVVCAGVLPTPGRPTTVKTRVLARHQQVVRFDREVDEPAAVDVARALAERVRALASGCDVLIVQDYDKGTLAPGVVDAVREVATARRLPWVVDPKRRSFFAYGGATVFKPNARELREALGEEIRPDDAAWMSDARTRLGCEHLLVTLGERGMSLQSAGSPLIHLPAVARDVFDVSGAGDTVTAAVALALAAGAAVSEAAAFATHAAAVEVAKSGVRTVSPEEIRAHVRSLA
jgi:D-beta-D-heptose 7-phosphate kinase/D-beta-D-heptose 1-phosphate adenosyltransferase